MQVAVPLCKTEASYRAHLSKLEKKSDLPQACLNTKWGISSKPDSIVVGWLKWFISLLPKVHLAQTNSLKVAKSIEKFAHKNAFFFTDLDQLQLVEIVKKLKKKSLKKNKKAFNKIIDRINAIKTTQTFKHVSDFPPEVLLPIFDYLGKDWRNATLVNSRLREIAISNRIRDESLLINKLHDFLVEHIQSQENLEDALGKSRKDYIQEVKKNFDFSEVTTLSQLKISIFKERLKIWYLIKNFTEEELKSLQESSKNLRMPFLFDDIFEQKESLEKNLAITEDFIKNGLYTEISHYLDEIFKDDPYNLQRICLKLTRHEELDFALAMANTIPKASYGNVFKMLSKSLIKKGRIDEAVELMDKIYDPLILRDIAVKLAKKQQFDQVRKLLKKISNPTDTLRRIAVEFAKKQQFDHAMQMICEISNPYDQNRTKKDICKIFMLNKDFTNAKNCALSISNVAFKNIVLNDAINFCLDKNLIEEALDFAFEVPRNGFKKPTLRRICQIFVNEGLFEKALNFMKVFPDDEDQSFFEMFAKELIGEKNQLQKIKELAFSISDEKMKSLKKNEVTQLRALRKILSLMEKKF